MELWLFKGQGGKVSKFKVSEFPSMGFEFRLQGKSESRDVAQLGAEYKAHIGNPIHPAADSV
jgi:hypothetical protein